MFTVNRNPSRDDLRKFGRAMFIGFFAIGALLDFFPFLSTGDVLALGWHETPLQYTAVGSMVLGVGLWVLSVAAPRAAKPVYVVWMTAAVAMGTVMTTILLTLLFVLFLPPFSLVVRLGDPLRKRLTGKDSYWEDYKPHEATLTRMQRPF